MKATTMWCGVAAVVATCGLAGCNGHEVEPFEGEVSAEVGERWQSVGTNKVDILWVVDNSGSMCEEQENLRENFDAFVAGLVEADVDFRLAVVSTDMQAPGHGGRFQHAPNGEPGGLCDEPVDVSHCPPPQELPPVIGSRDPAYQRDGALDVERLQRDFGCNATVGITGSGFEMGLEAARAALSPGLLESHNAGFLREEAYLAIVFLTDENDCSDRGALELTNGDVCEWDRDALVPVEEYVAFFEGLKPDPEQVIVAGITAPDNGLRYETGETVSPSCDSEDGEGYSSYRYESVIRAFEHSTVANICEPEQFPRALETIAERIEVALEGRCLESPPLTCEADADCGEGACVERGGHRFCEGFAVQVEVTRPAGSGAMGGAACEPTAGGDTRCVLVEGEHYELDFGATQCPASGIAVDLGVKLQPGEALTVRYPRAVEVLE